MESVENKLALDDKITARMIADKDFCLSIVSCKDTDEVKKFLASKGINVSKSDIDNLAKNISEIADICKKLDDKDLDGIVGGGWDEEQWGRVSKNTAKVLGIGALVTTGLLVLTFVGAGIKKLGDEKGWWDKYRNRT